MTGPVSAESIALNLAAVRSRIERSATRSGRQASDIRLVAVSKTFPPEAVRAAAAAGQVDFGENRVQEALDKVDATTDLSLRWHLIGHLQRNKVRRCVGPFALVHSVDSVELLDRVDAVALEVGTTVDVLIQVNLADEATKSGASPAEAERLFDRAGGYRGAQVRGLMLVPPFLEDPEAVRPHFRQLRELRGRLAARGVGAVHLRDLSMGMSHDFEVAIEEGATIVRVGTAIFGNRM